jgi:hypothetical protein
MNRPLRNRSMIIVVWLSTLGTFLAATGCADGSRGDESLEPGSKAEARRGAPVPAGVSSAALGITSWRIENGFVEGFDAEDHVIAEFYLDGMARTIESIACSPHAQPDRSSRAINRRCRCSTPQSSTIAMIDGSTSKSMTPSCAS